MQPHVAQLKSVCLRFQAQRNNVTRQIIDYSSLGKLMRLQKVGRDIFRYLGIHANKRSDDAGFI